MRTITYAVYDAASGDVVHMHVEPAGLDSSAEEILKMVSAPKHTQLKVIRVPDDFVVSGSLRVEKDELRSVDEATAGGGGISHPLDEPSGPRTYESVQRSRS